MVRWWKENNPDDPELPKFLAWHEGYYPAMHGSHWACDAPLYLNYLIHIGYIREQLYQEICAMHEWGNAANGHQNTEANRIAWQRAFRVAEQIRNGVPLEEISCPDR
jgi:hypothetical protein